MILMTFKHLNLAGLILKALQEEGYEKPIPIQEEAIPIVLTGLGGNSVNRLTYFLNALGKEITYFQGISN